MKWTECVAAWGTHIARSSLPSGVCGCWVPAPEDPRWGLPGLASFTRPPAREMRAAEQRFTLFLAIGTPAEWRCHTVCPHVCHGPTGAVRACYESSCCERMCLSFGHRGCSGMTCCVTGTCCWFLSGTIPCRVFHGEPGGSSAWP